MSERQIDPISGTPITGHEWDGLKELDTPVPLVVKVAFAVVGVWALGFWLLFPAFPTPGGGHTTGALGFTSRAAVEETMVDAAERAADWRETLIAADLDALSAEPERLGPLLVGAEVQFRENCGVCHGWDGKGRTGEPAGFPNLTDTSWLWSGSASGIYTTLVNGINGTHPDALYAQMPAFVRDQLLTAAEVDRTIEYVRQIAGLDHDGVMAGEGAPLFQEHCAACHGEDGAAGLENGAPNLIDAEWIYGSSRATLQRTIYSGRQGVMPHWSGRLDDAVVRQLALYVHELARPAREAAPDAGGS